MTDKTQATAHAEITAPISADLRGIEQKARELPEPSPTAGMNLGRRILHVGGRENAAGYIEFGSVAAVRALVGQVLRDLQPAQPARECLQQSATVRDAAAEKPEAGRYVLAWMEGKASPIRAMWVPSKWLQADDECPEDWAEYDEAKDEYFCPEGWYEKNEHEEKNWSVSTPVVAWMELPRLDAALQAAPPAPECGNCFEGKSDLDHTCRKCGGSRAAAPAQAAYSREEWIAQAAQVFVDDGDDQKAAQDLARWHWNQQDWTSGEIDDPREVAREDLAGREKPTAPAQAVAVPSEVELPDVEDMAHSAVQEALSFGVNHDVFHRWMRAVMDKTVQALAAGAEQAPEQWIDDPHDIEQGRMLNPEWVRAQEHATQLAGQGPTPEELMALSRECTKMPGGLGMHYQNYARAVLARWGAAPAQAQEDARDALTLDELDQLDRAIEHFGEGEDTDVDWQLLTRAASLGYLECERFTVPPSARAAIDAARAAQRGAAC